MKRFLAFVIVVLLTPVSSFASDLELVIGQWRDGEGRTSDAEVSPLKTPFGIDFDPDGRMWIVELSGGRVHRRNVNGRVELIGGDGSESYRGDGGPASKATFNGMHNVAVTKNGDVLIADSWNHCVRRIDPESGQISTLYGTGQAGFSGDGGAARKADFNFIMCITLDWDERNLLIADLKNRRIRSVELKTGVVRTIAGNGSRGVPEDGTKAVESPLVDPRAVAGDRHGNVYVLERGGHALRVVSPDGRIRTVCGFGERGFQDGGGRTGRLNSSKHLAIDRDDNIFIAEDANRAIRKFVPSTGELTTVLGRGFGHPDVELSKPHGVCVEGEWLYIVDTGHDRVFRMPIP